MTIDSDRDEALLALRASEARWRQLANSMPQLVWTCNSIGAFDFLSEQWVAYTGRGEAEQLGAGWLEQVHPRDQEDTQRRWQAAVIEKKTFQAEFRIRRHDGVYRWFDTQAVPLLDSGRSIRGWIGTNTDVEDRRRAEDALRHLNDSLERRVAQRTAALEAAERDVRNILDSIPSKVSYWDRDLNNRFSNRVYFDWFGIDATRIPGMHMRDLLGNTVFERRQPHIEAALRGETVSFNDAVPRLDGLGLRHAAVRYIPDIVEGHVRGFYAHSSDISDLIVASERAEAANVAKTAFLANMSHEIRTPMNAVFNLTYLLEQTGLQAEQRDFVDKIKIASRSLLGVINDILDLSKVEAGQMTLAADVFNLRAVVDDVAKLMAAAVAGKQLELKVRIANPVPDFVRGDSLRLSQILNNLVSNAIKFTERGSVCIDIDLEPLVHLTDHIRLSVEDTGIGIAPDVMPNLFRPFMQADDSTTRRHGGTGLGLAIVRRLAELMGGEAGVESQFGHGSRFWVSLPLPRQQRAIQTPTAPPPFEALVVDDDDARRNRLNALARTLGWSCVGAASADEALSRLGDAVRGGRAFDVVIVEWAVADVDGLELLRRLRSADATIAGTPAVLITARKDKSLSGIADAQIVDALLPKPDSAAILFEAIHTAVARRNGNLGRLVGGRAPPPAGPRLPGVRILLVDDSKINLEVGRRILQKEGALVTLAEDGQQAVDRLREQPQAYDIVLMDVQMPTLDGHEASRLIRKDLGLRDLPILALTAGALASERERALAAGMDDFITKPFDPNAMVLLLRQWASRGRPLPEIAVRPSIAPEAVKIPAPNWPQVDGIDTDQSRSRLSGDQALFRHSLRHLLDDYADFGPALDPAGKDDAVIELKRRAHRLCGVAGTLGAARLHALAGQLEQQLRERPEASVVSMLIEIGQQLKLIGNSASTSVWLADEKRTTRSSAAPITSLDANTLREMLRQQNMAAIDEFARQRSRWISSSDPKRVMQLDKLIQDLDFVRALDLLSILASEVPESPAMVDRRRH